MKETLLPDWANKLLTEGQKGKLELCHTFVNSRGTFLLFRLKAHTTVYKKVQDSVRRNQVIELTLNRNTILCLNSFSKKMRASKAFVKRHYLGTCVSRHDDKFKYNSETVIAPTKPFELVSKDECAAGIHFFFNKTDAVNY